MTRHDFLWLLLVLAGSSAGVVATGRGVGATFDEPFYVRAGLEAWRTGSNQALMRAGTMPLPVDVQTLPLVVWERARGEPFHPVSDLHELLPVARAANLPFWWLLLIYGWRLGRLWGGPAAGRFAVALLGCEPNLIAHAGLATTDVAATAGVLAAVYHFATGRGGSWTQRVLIPGVAAGLAVACKASAVTFVPLGWLVVFLATRRCEPPGSENHPAVHTAGSPIRDLYATAVIAAVVLFVYCGTDWAVEPSFVRWAHALPDGPVADATRTVAAHLRIFPNAGEGLVQQVKHNFRGHDTFVLGEWHRRAVWYYFPVVLSMKLTEPVLLLLAGLLVVRPKSLWNPAGRVALAYLLFSLTCRVQIGVRLVFPLVTFLHLAAAVAVSRSTQPDAATADRRWAARMSQIVVQFSALIAILSVSDGLRHLNRFWGGRERADAVLTDSNYDWGQGLPELARWQAATGQPDLTVWYFGTDPAILLPPFRLLQPDPTAELTVADVRQKVGSGYLAVGATVLTACPDRRPGPLAVVNWLNGLTPVAKVGPFRVYKLG